MINQPSNQLQLLVIKIVIFVNMSGQETGVSVGCRLSAGDIGALNSVHHLQILHTTIINRSLDLNLRGNVKSGEPKELKLLLLKLLECLAVWIEGVVGGSGGDGVDAIDLGLFWSAFVQGKAEEHITLISRTTPNFCAARAAWPHQ